MFRMRNFASRFGLSPAGLVMMAGAGVLLYIVYKGSVSKAIGTLATTAGEAAVTAAGGLVVGTVTGASNVVGLPTPAQTATDPAVARWIMDDPRGGQFAASKWASFPAYAQALMMPAGSGRAPAPGSAVAAQFPPYIDVGHGASGSW